MAIGAIIIIADCLCWVYYYSSKDEEACASCGCFVMLLLVALCVASCFIGDHCYISRYGGARHYYIDCKEIEGKSWQEVGKVSAYIWGCTEECSKCSKRKDVEKRKRLQLIKEKQKAHDLKFIDNQISELKRVRQAIIKGEEIDVDDYQFMYEVEDEIRESALEDYKDCQYESLCR